MFSEGRASREITPVLHISRPSTSPLVWVVGPGCGSWSSESVLEDGVEDDGDDEHDDDDVEFDGDADQSRAEGERQCGAGALECSTALECDVMFARWTASTDQDYRPPNTHTHTVD